MLRVVNIRCLTLDIDYVDVYWEYIAGADPKDYSFRILRSEAQFGPFEPISKWFSDRFHFRDSAPPKRNSVRHIYYKIEVRNDATLDAEIYPAAEQPGESVSAQSDLVALEIARISRLKLKEFEGRLVWVFPRRTFGTRCTKCYDQITQQKLRSNCASCYGTGFLGGYHSPVQCYMSITDPQNTVQTTDMGKLTPIKGSGRLANYPIINEDDIVVEAENIRWRVFAVSNVTKNRAVIRQNFGLERIALTDAAYKLPVRVDLINLDISAPREFTNPQSLGGTVSVQND